MPTPSLPCLANEEAAAGVLWWEECPKGSKNRVRPPQWEHPLTSESNAAALVTLCDLVGVVAQDYFFIPTTRMKATAPMRSTDERTIPVSEPTPLRPLPP